MRHIQYLLYANAVMFCSATSLQNRLSSHPPMNCCYLEEPPISFPNPVVNSLNGIDGVIAEYLRELQSHLGWTCANMIPFPQEHSNGFNSAVNTISKCTNYTTGTIMKSPNCTCEIGIGGWFQTLERFGKVDFLPPFSIDSYRAFTTVSSTLNASDGVVIFGAFDLYAWMSIFALFLMFTFLKMLDVRFANAAPYTPLPATFSKAARYSHYLQKSRVFFRLRKGIQSTVTRMLLMPDDAVVENGKSTRQWFLNLVLSACALFLILSYEASMTASLVQESVFSRYRTVDDLKMCRIPPSEICIYQGGALETYWKTVISQYDCHKGNGPTYVASYEELFQKVSNGTCTYGIAMQYAIKSETWKKSCGRFVIVGEPVWTSGLSIIVPRGSPLTEIMSFATIGFLRNQSKSAMQKWFDANGECASDARTVLSFKRLQLFFLLAFSVGGCIFVWMLLDPKRAFITAGGENASSMRELCSFPKEHARDDDCSFSSREESFNVSVG